MAEKKDVRQGTLALMILKTLGEHGLAPRLRHRTPHRADQRRHACGSVRHDLPPASETGAGGACGFGMDIIREQPPGEVLPPDPRRPHATRKRSSEWQETTAVVARFLSLGKEHA